MVGAKIFQGEGMNKYNAEHYVDYTAAIAVSRADRRKTKNIHKAWLGLTYQIKEVCQIKHSNGKIELCK